MDPQEEKSDPRLGSGPQSSDDAAGHTVPEVIEVTPHATVNPLIRKFGVNTMVLMAGSMAFDRPSQARHNELAKRLFALKGVRRIYAVANTVTVTRGVSSSWTELEPRVCDVISEVLGSTASGDHHVEE